MNNQSPKLYASLLGISGAFLGCIALSGSVRAGSQPYVHGVTNLLAAAIAASPAASYPSTCVLFRDGFDATPSPIPDAGAAVSIVTSGGYTISVDRGTIRIGDSSGLNVLVTSGNLHEYLNGKHIKDWGGEAQWDDARRSFILDDGTKITLVSNDHSGVILQASIYYGVENLQIDGCSNEITHQSSDPGDTLQRDAAQYDGEVATFSTNATSGVATFTNYYNQDRNSNVINIQFILGTTGGYANPNQVIDLYDDPRHPWT